VCEGKRNGMNTKTNLFHKNVFFFMSSKSPDPHSPTGGGQHSLSVDMVVRALEELKVKEQAERAEAARLASEHTKRQTAFTAVYDALVAIPKDDGTPAFPGILPDGAATTLEGNLDLGTMKGNLEEGLQEHVAAALPQSIKAFMLQKVARAKTDLPFQAALKNFDLNDREAMVLLITVIPGLDPADARTLLHDLKSYAKATAKRPPPPPPPEPLDQQLERVIRSMSLLQVPAPAPAQAQQGDKRWRDSATYKHLINFELSKMAEFKRLYTRRSEAEIANFVSNICGANAKSKNIQQITIWGKRLLEPSRHWTDMVYFDDWVKGERKTALLHANYLNILTYEDEETRLSKCTQIDRFPDDEHFFFPANFSCYPSVVNAPAFVSDSFAPPNLFSFACEDDGACPDDDDDALLELEEIAAQRGGTIIRTRGQLRAQGQTIAATTQAVREEEEVVPHAPAAKNTGAKTTPSSKEKKQTPPKKPSRRTTTRTAPPPATETKRRSTTAQVFPIEVDDAESAPRREEEDPVVTVIRPFYIRRSELDRVSGTYWLDGTVVNAMHRLVANQVNACHIHSYAESQLTNGHKPHLYPHFLNTSNKIIVTINADYDHWGALLIDLDRAADGTVKSASVTLADSAAGHIKTRHYERTLAYLKSKFGGNPWRPTTAEVRRQTNGYDCGPLAILAAARFAAKTPIDGPIPKDIRPRLAAAILAHDPSLSGLVPKVPSVPGRKEEKRKDTVAKAQVVQLFLKGEPNSQLAPIAQGVSSLKNLTVKMPNEPMLRDAITLATRRAHITAITALIEASQQYEDIHLPHLLMNTASKLSTERKWKPATTLHFINSAVSGLQRLDQYAPGTQPIDLSQSSIIKDIRRSWNRKVNQDLLRPRPTLTPEMFKSILRNPRLKTDTRMALLLAWATAGRVSNVLTLDRRNVTISSTGEISVFWTEAKTVLKRGPYTTPTFVPQEWLTPLVEWLSSKKDNLFPPQEFHRTLRDVREALPKEYDLRALRRGTLSTLARAGVPEETIMILSGHVTTASLWRYLRFRPSTTTVRTLVQAAHDTLWA
jgi:integrase